MKLRIVQCLPALLKLLFLQLMVWLWLSPNELNAQVIDESTPQVGTWEGVGADSADFVAQSFEADIKRVRKIGVWLQAAAPDAQVRLAIMGDNGNNQPDLNFVLHESDLIAPSVAGAWVYDSTFSAVLVPGDKYWIVVDGYQNLAGSGYAAVGTSNVFTDTGDPLRISLNGGQSWLSLPANPMAVHVEGDNCNFSLQISPTSAVVCPDSHIVLSVPTGFVSYAWSDGQTSSSIWATDPGIYSVSVVDANNCTSTASVQVLQGIVPQPQLNSIYTVCEGSQVIVQVPPFYSSYLWSSGNTGSRDTVSQAGIYWVDVRSSAGCLGTDTFELIVFDRPDLILGQDTTACEGDTLHYEVLEGMPIYIWSTGATTNYVDIHDDTQLWLYVTDSNNCVTVSDTIDIEIGPLPPIPLISKQETKLQSSLALHYQWYKDGQALSGENSRDLLQPAPGSYFVEVSNAFGCSSRSAVVVVDEVVVVQDFISGGISPNGDGLNDYFYVEGLNTTNSVKLKVMNRWGELVFETEDYQNDWDGRGMKGQALPDGTYYYLLDFGDGTEAKKGSITIHR